MSTTVLELVVDSVTVQISTGSQQGDRGIQGIQGNTGIQGFTGLQGTQGLQGLKGNQGDFGGASFYYRFLTKTDSVDPGAGNINVNSTNLSTATFLSMDDLDRNNIDISEFIKTIDDSTSSIKGLIRITEENNLTNFLIYNITGTQIDNATHFDIPISFVTGRTTPFSNNQNIIISFLANGDRGTQGVQGIAIQGIQGPAGSVQGIQGIQGTDGTQGIQGIQGPQGVQGTQGIQGVQGTQGTQGIQGTQGTQGVQGIQGIQSIQGIQGPVGPAGAGGGGSGAVRNVSSDATILNTDEFIFATNNITLTLPSITGNTGKILHIQNSGTGQVTIVAPGTELINREKTLVLQYRYSAVDLIASSTQWVLF
ncbi:hypothetical protein EBZ38_01605 [bacterium]|nr:hypothetical protein [bacterium]